MAAPKLHLDEARARSVTCLKAFLATHPAVERAVVIDDLFGTIRVVAWAGVGEAPADLERELIPRLQEAAGQFWSGNLWFAGADAQPEHGLLYEAAWEEGIPLDSSVQGQRLRINDRHRNRMSWFLPVAQREALQAPRTGSEDPPGSPRARTVVFHSFKGGVGRTTSLAAYALSHARQGERVVVVDLDLDAPGIGGLLDSDGEGTTAHWGVVDFLLEARHKLDLADYFHTCARDGLTSPGLIEVFPGGQLDDYYLTKLARVDLEVGRDPAAHPLFELIRRIDLERKPDLILVDGRAGLSPGAGLVLSGFADLHVLFATVNPQSLLGLNRVVRHLGLEQARRGRPQLECVIAQAMVPDDSAVAADVQQRFAGAVLKMFEDGYYAQAAPDTDDPTAEPLNDSLWTLDDLDSSVAPHRPVPIRYRASLSSFNSVDQVVRELSEGDHAVLTERLDQRLGLPSEKRS